MGKSLLIAGNQSTTTQNTTQYTFITGINDLGSSEAPKQVPFRDAGVISKFGVKIVTNTTSTNTVVRLRKNGANGNQSVTISGGQTGEFIDNTNTDSISAGDKISVQIVTPNTGTVTIQLIAAIYEPTDTNITTTRLLVGKPVSHNASTVFYNLLNGDLDLDDTTTTDHRIIPRIAGSFKHWALYSSAGGRAVACRLLKNNTDDFINRILLDINVTGLGENTTDSISSNTTDDFTNMHVYGGGANGSRTLDFIALSFVNTGPYSLILGGQSDDYVRGPNVTDYHRIGGYFVASATENDVKMKARASFTLSKLAIRIAANSINTGTSTFKLRKNGADSGLVINVSAGQTGTLVDNTNTVEVTENDELDYEFDIVGTSGTIALTWASMVAESETAPASLNMDVTDTIVLTNKFITKV